MPSSSPFTVRLRDRVAEFFRWAEIDRAVFYTLLTRAWQVLTGPVTLVLIARHMTLEVQGYYYTFASILALQSFVELGLYVVVINLASHEWAHLRLNEDGSIGGSPQALDRLISLGRFICRWYAVASVLFCLGVGVAGWMTFSKGAASGIGWQAPWLFQVAATGVTLWVMPFISLLEGCNQVAAVNRFRLSRAFTGNASLWLVLLAGGGLWAAPVSTIVKLILDVYLLVGQYGAFFRPFRTATTTAVISWKGEIWPMQWRLGIAGVANYFAFSLFNPVMFLYHGAAVAGRMGMSLQIVSTVQMIGLAWVSVKAPQFGMLVARRDFSGLDRYWWRITLVSSAAVIMVAAAIALGVYAIGAIDLSIAKRLLPFWPTCMLLLAAALMHVSQCQTAYILAHKEAPFVVLALGSGSAIGALVWLLGRRYGPVGASMGYLAVVALFVVPYETWLWLRCRGGREQSSLEAIAPANA